MNNTQLSFHIQLADLDSVIEQLNTLSIQPSVDSSESSNYPIITAVATQLTHVQFCKGLSYGGFTIAHNRTTQQFIDDTKVIKQQMSELLTMYQLQYNVKVTDLTAHLHDSMSLDTVDVDFTTTLRNY